MKNFTLSVATVLALSTFAVAGGDIAPVEPAVEVPEVVVNSDSGFYIGGAYGSADVDESWSYEDGSSMVTQLGEYEEEHDTFMFQAGYQFNKYLAVEGRYWASVSDPDWSDKWDVYYNGVYQDSFSVSGSDDCELDAWGIYLKPMYPLTEEFSVYGLLGYGNVTLSDGSGYDWIDENGFQWGLGASYAITEHLSIFADYVSLLDGNDGSYTNGTAPNNVIETWEDDVDTINIGITYKF